MLDTYRLSFPAQEFELYCLIKEFEFANIEVLPFTFSRFENEAHKDIEKDVQKALENAITVLKEKRINLTSTLSLCLVSFFHKKTHAKREGNCSI